MKRRNKQGVQKNEVLTVVWLSFSLNVPSPSGKYQRRDTERYPYRRTRIRKDEAFPNDEETLPYLIHSIPWFQWSPALF